jgi:hypothetical protein
MSNELVSVIDAIVDAAEEHWIAEMIGDFEGARRLRDALRGPADRALVERARTMSRVRDYIERAARSMPARDRADFLADAKKDGLI